jgi:hypothetical protein
LASSPRPVCKWRSAGGSGAAEPGASQSSREVVRRVLMSMVMRYAAIAGAVSRRARRAK